MLKTCIVDGTDFEAKREDAKYCSPKCRKAAARAVGVDPETGEVIEPQPASYQWPAKRDTSSVTTPVTVTDNPFERPAPDGYDPEAALKAFKKMGLDEVEWLTTGIPSFDKLTKIPKGRLTQIEGRYSVGKTTLCLNMIAGLRDKNVLYIDTEASLNPSLLVALRINPQKFELFNKSAYLEDIAPLLREAVSSKKYDLIVLDSLAMTTTKTIDEGKITDANIGQKAKIFNKTLELLMGDLRDSKTALVIINQTRDKIGTYTPETYTPGGSGKDFNASLKISLKTIPSWRFSRTATETKAKKNFIGQKVEATITKSKVNTPHRKAEFNLYYPNPIQEDNSEAQF